MICSISPLANAWIGFVGTIPAMTCQNDGASAASIPVVSTPVMSKLRPGPISVAIAIATVTAKPVVNR